MSTTVKGRQTALRPDLKNFLPNGHMAGQYPMSVILCMHIHIYYINTQAYTTISNLWPNDFVNLLYIRNKLFLIAKD